MKTILITPIHPKLPFKKPLPTYQVQNYWVKAFKKLDQQVKVFGLLNNQSKLVNFFKLKKLLKSSQPDQVFFSAGLDKLLPIKNTIFFCGVPPTKLSGNELKTGINAKLIVVNDPEHRKNWQKLTDKPVVNLPYSAVNLEVFNPGNLKRIIDISFVGTLFTNRQKQLAEIVKEGIKLKIWGWLPPGTCLHPGLKKAYQGEAWGQKVVKIYQQSIAALNLVPDHMIDGGNLRTFEIPACKALQFTDKINPNYYQPSKEIIVFNSPTDLKSKLNHYLSHPKQANQITTQAYLKTTSHHTFETRFKKLIKLL